MAPGLFVSASIEGEVLSDILIAPRNALRGKDQVYVADPETEELRIRNVDVMYSDPDGVYIRSGLEPGDLAITSPVQAPFDGMSISLATDD